MTIGEQLKRLQENVEGFEKQRGLEDHIYKLYPQEGDGVFSVKSYTIGKDNKTEQGKIQVGLKSPETGLGKWGDVVELSVNSDTEGNFTGLGSLYATYYPSPKERYLISYHAENDPAVAEMDKVIKASQGFHIDHLPRLNPNDEEVKRLNLADHGFPRRVDWLATAFKYTTGQTPDGHPLTARDIRRKPLIPARDENVIFEAAK